MAPYAESVCGECGRSHLLGFLFCADGSAQLATGESDRNVIAYVHLIDGSHDFPGSVVHNRVAALENTEWAALFQLQRGRLPASALGDERAIEPHAQLR